MKIGSRAGSVTGSDDVDDSVTRLDGQLLENAVRLGWAWRFIRRARMGILVDATAAGLNQMHLEPGDVDTLDQVAINGGEGQMSDIAAGLQVEPSSATRAVRRLEDKGLVCRRRDPVDGRVTRVSLTEAGVAVQAEARERRTAYAMRLLERFDPEDQQAIARAAELLADAIAEELGVIRDQPATSQGHSLQGQTQ